MIIDFHTQIFNNACNGSPSSCARAPQYTPTWLAAGAQNYSFQMNARKRLCSKMAKDTKSCARVNVDPPTLQNTKACDPHTATLCSSQNPLCSNFLRTGHLQLTHTDQLTFQEPDSGRLVSGGTSREKQPFQPRMLHTRTQGHLTPLRQRQSRIPASTSGPAPTRQRHTSGQASTWTCFGESLARKAQASTCEPASTEPAGSSPSRDRTSKLGYQAVTSHNTMRKTSERTSFHKWTCFHHKTTQHQWTCLHSPSVFREIPPACQRHTRCKGEGSTP